MRDDLESEKVGVVKGFQTTCWTAVEAAGLESELALQTLQDLLIRYSEPLQRHLIYRYRFSRSDAQDVFQDFVHEKVLLSNILDSADRDRGRFRTFLLTALDRFVLNRLRAAETQRRRPRKGFVSIDDVGLEECGTEETSDPFATFWTAQVVREVLKEMERECDEKGVSTRWLVFKSQVVDPIFHDQERESQLLLAERLGLRSRTVVSNTLLTAKRMYQRILNRVVADYSGDQDQVDLELLILRSSLARRSVA